MKMQYILFLLCMVTLSIESNPYQFKSIGVKRKTENYPRSSRKSPRLIPMHEEFIMQVDYEKIDDALDILSDIASEGFLTPELTTQIDTFIDNRKNLSPTPQVFVPIQRHLAWLVKLNSID